MAHASFPLSGLSPALPRPIALSRLRLRTRAVPLLLATAIVVLTALGLTALDTTNARLESSISVRESANRSLAADIGTTQRIAAATAIRVADLRAVLDQQRAALDSRDGFLP